MTRAHHGSSVTISYIGTLNNRRIFHSTEEHGPHTFTIGSGQVFPALEQAITDMRGGEVKNVVLTAANAQKVTLDGNHPLAGLELTFALKVEGVA